MKRAKKIVALLVAAVLLVTTTVAVTVAYMSSLTDVVTNTFTSGNVTITLDEADVNIETTETVEGETVTTVEYTEWVADNAQVTTRDEADRVTSNVYKLYPNKTYQKDPTVHVGATSEDCYVFIKVENGIEELEAGETIAEQMATKGWAVLDAVNYPGIYYYNGTKATNAVVSAGEDLVVFEEFTVKSDADADELDDYSTASVNITAYAVQAETFTSVTDAWSKAPTSWTK
ncbi:MAG: hypothetical protein IKV52_04210 [Oscillospiraceae bacterium]|nr:hypothetical protein [Oscillospiraceae bacterium]